MERMITENSREAVFHVPHDGTQFPEELLSSVCIPLQRFQVYHETMRDRDAAKMIPEEYRDDDHLVAFPVSRLLCDVERFLGPEEEMEQYGMGFCYEKVYDGTQIKNVTTELKEKTLPYYWAHHAKVDRFCRIYPRIVFFDIHSYSDLIVPASHLRPGHETPDVCIGTDERFTPPELRNVCARIFTEAGFSTAENDPYTGCLVPNAVFGGSGQCDCISVMLEFNKRCYLRADGTSDPEILERIRSCIREAVSAGRDL